mgnify:CR=1 FL=1
MQRYYTRACNFYFGSQSKVLVKKKKTIPLHQIKEISFDHIEIITRKSKKKISINQIKYLPNDLKKKVYLFVNLFCNPNTLLICKLASSN